MITFFRMLAAVTQREATATMFGGLSILVLVITVGLVTSEFERLRT